ncbi:MAG: hypothetical protein ACP5LE_05045 [Thermoplasmata archaeon]
MALCVFAGISLQFAGTGMPLFIFLGMIFSLVYLLLCFYQRLEYGGLLLGFCIPLVACSSILYVGKVNLVIFPVAGLLLVFTALFFHIPMARFVALGTMEGFYTHLKSSILLFALVVAGGLFFSAFYFLLITILPRVQATVFDVLAGIIAVSVSLLVLGHLMTRGK